MQVIHTPCQKLVFSTQKGMIPLTRDSLLLSFRGRAPKVNRYKKKLLAAYEMGERSSKPGPLGSLVNTNHQIRWFKSRRETKRHCLGHKGRLASLVLG